MQLFTKEIMNIFQKQSIYNTSGLFRQPRQWSSYLVQVKVISIVHYISKTYILDNSTLSLFTNKIYNIFQQHVEIYNISGLFRQPTT